MTLLLHALNFSRNAGRTQDPSPRLKTMLKYSLVHFWWPLSYMSYLQRSLWVDVAEEAAVDDVMIELTVVVVISVMIDRLRHGCLTCFRRILPFLPTPRSSHLTKSVWTILFRAPKSQQAPSCIFPGQKGSTTTVATRCGCRCCRLPNREVACE